MSTWSSPLDIDRELENHKMVVQFGFLNFQGGRIPVQSGLNIVKWRT